MFKTTSSIFLMVLSALLWSCGEKQNNRAVANKRLTPKNKAPITEDVKDVRRSFFLDKVKPLLQKEPCSSCHHAKSSSCSLDILDYDVAVTLIRSPSKASKDSNNFYVRMNEGESHQDFACKEDNQNEICKAVQLWWELEPKDPLNPAKRHCTENLNPLPLPSALPPPSAEPVLDLKAKDFFDKVVFKQFENRKCTTNDGSAWGCHGPSPQGSNPAQDPSQKLDYWKAREYLLKAKNVGSGGSKEDFNVLINAIFRSLNNSGAVIPNHRHCSSLFVSPCREIKLWYQKETNPK